MGATRKLSVRRAAEQTLSFLREHRNEAKAASYQRFFKEPVNYFGLDHKTMQAYKKDLLARVAGNWTIDDAVRYCDAMVKDEYMESRGIGYQMVAAFVEQAPAGLLVDIKRWLTRTCGNWGLVDNLAPSVLAPLLDLHPTLIPEVVDWTGSSSLWVRRGAVVAFVPLVTRKKKYQTVAYRIVTRLLDDDEDLIHKAVGWLLREAGKTDAGRLEKFLLDKGSRMPRTSLRYAIERFPKEDRRRLLMETKGATPGKTRG